MSGMAGTGLGPQRYFSGIREGVYNIFKSKKRHMGALHFKYSATSTYSVVVASADFSNLSNANNNEKRSVLDNGLRDMPEPEGIR